MSIKRFFSSLSRSNEDKNDEFKLFLTANNKSNFAPQAVDLGLPSGVLWADRNVGADAPEDGGIIICWGGHEGWRNGRLLYPNDSCYSQRSNTNMSIKIYTKYRTKPVHILADNKTVLDFEDDAACLFLGEKWVTPTKEEIQELIDNTDIENVNYRGYRYTSKINGNSIFLPEVLPKGPIGAIHPNQSWYWSSSLCPTIENTAYCLEQSDIYEVWSGIEIIERECALPIRPIIRRTNSEFKPQKFTSMPKEQNKAVCYREKAYGDSIKEIDQLFPFDF